MAITVDKKAWEKLKKNFLEAESYEGRLGWFPENRYSSDNENLAMAQVAKWNEEGQNNGIGALIPGAETPPRPFMRVNLRNKLISGSNTREFKNIVEAVANGKSILQPLKQAGNEFQDTLQDVMRDFDNPGNAPLTIALKGFDDPLRNSGQLIENVNYKVSKKGKD